MINNVLHPQPVAVDRNDHRAAKVAVPVTDWGMARPLNALFVAAVEFGDAAREFPVVFVAAGDDEDGKPAIAPIAVFGMEQRQNLFVDDSGRWRGRYMPAVLRVYPFCIGRLDAERYAICLDAGWSGVSRDGTGPGERLFADDGQPTPLMQEVQKQLEVIEAEVQRTRLMCRRLRDLNLLREMRFDATLPDGQTLAVDGFLTVDEAALAALPDADVVDLHKTGLLGLIHAHFVSLGHMRKLLDWNLERRAAQASGASVAPAAV